MIWRPGLGACLAAAVMGFAGLSCYGELARPDFNARDLFAGRPQPAAASVPSAVGAWLLSWNGDFLAHHAAVQTGDVLNRPALDAATRSADNKAAQQMLVSALKISPIRPALWLSLGLLNSQMGEPVAPALKMSYLTGSVPPAAAFSRLQIVTSTSAASDEQIRLLAQSDMRAALADRARFEAPLVAAYVQATPEGKSLLLEASQLADPKFSAMLRRY